MDSGSALDFAYKYPFSKEAKEIVQRQGNEINGKYLMMGGKQIEGFIDKALDYSDISINSVKLDYVMTYLYSRMLLSTLRRPDLIKIYAIAVAGRSAQALERSENAELIRLASELGMNVTGTFNNGKSRQEMSELFSMRVVDYLNNLPRNQRFELVNQRISGGVVVLDKSGIVRVIEQAMTKEILRGLPIKSSELPKEIIEYSKTIKVKPPPKLETIPKGKRSEEWIERLLQTPIADVRHRTVNLILAPYLVNTKQLEVDQAIRIINDYIERCKQIDPNTKITDRYIEYQCNYAKRRGLKPLSFDHAKELLGSAIEIN